MNLTLKKYFVLTTLCIACSLLHAMPGPPAAGGSPPAGAAPAGAPPTGSPPAGGPPCWSPPCIPIDGGIGLLLAAGALIGVRRIYKGSEDKADTQA